MMHQWGLRIPLHPGAVLSEGRFAPTPGLCTICMSPAAGTQQTKACLHCNRSVHMACAGSMGVTNGTSWVCPLCVDPAPASRTACFLCPQALQLDVAIRVKTPVQVQGLLPWVHPLCGQAWAALRLNSVAKCGLCVSDVSARHWLRILCAHPDCEFVMHTACVLRETARGNCKILVEAATTDQPPAGPHFGPTRRSAGLCPTHRDYRGELRTATDPPCGEFGEAYPQVGICHSGQCDAWTTAQEGGQCSFCAFRFCPTCSVAGDGQRLCLTCIPPPTSI